MSRAVTVLTDAESREQAKFWIDKAPTGTRLEFKAPRRTLAQNRKLWALLTEVATKASWVSRDGKTARKLKSEDWKLLFLDGLKGEGDLVLNLDGTGFVNLNLSSSDLSRDEMAQMIELIYHFCAQHDIKLRDLP